MFSEVAFKIKLLKQMCCLQSNCFSNLYSPQIALRILLLLFLPPFHGHVFLRGVVFHQPSHISAFTGLQSQNSSAFHLCHLHYLNCFASCLQPTERRCLHHPHQRWRQQWEHVQEHHGMIWNMGGGTLQGRIVAVSALRTLNHLRCLFNKLHVQPVYIAWICFWALSRKHQLSSRRPCCSKQQESWNDTSVVPESLARSQITEHHLLVWYLTVTIRHHHKPENLKQ